MPVFVACYVWVRQKEGRGEALGPTNHPRARERERRLFQSRDYLTGERGDSTAGDLASSLEAPGCVWGGSVQDTRRPRVCWDGRTAEVAQQREPASPHRATAANKRCRRERGGSQMGQHNSNFELASEARRAAERCKSCVFLVAARRTGGVGCVFPCGGKAVLNWCSCLLVFGEPRALLASCVSVCVKNGIFCLTANGGICRGRCRRGGFFFLSRTARPQRPWNTETRRKLSITPPAVWLYILGKRKVSSSFGQKRW